MMDDAKEVTIIEKNSTPAVASEAVSIMAVIERAALNPDVDIEKMERLFALHEKAVTRQAEVSFNEAMRQAQGAIKMVVRTHRNQQTSSNYADMAAVNSAVMPVATQHGFSISFGTADCPVPNHMRITATVSHAAGHSRVYQADVPTDAVGLKGNANKTATHAFGSTMTYGRRYLLLLIFNVATSDDDGNGAGNPNQVVTDDELETLKEEGYARAESGMEALESWWKGTLTPAERKAVGMNELKLMKDRVNGTA